MTLLVGNNAGTTSNSVGSGFILFCCSKSGSNFIGQQASFGGVVQSLLVSCNSAGSSGKQLQAAIYDSGGSTINLLGFSVIYQTNGGESGSNIVLPMISKVTITSGAFYILALWNSKLGQIGINMSNNGNTTNLYYSNQGAFVPYGWPSSFPGLSNGTADYLNMWASDNCAAAWCI